tara:strand:- start:31 stop:231 length:201 start_codon:yes stop_codon:yes gene_type:complete
MTNQILSIGALASVVVLAWLLSSASIFNGQAPAIGPSMLAPVAHAAPTDHDHEDHNHEQASGQQNG